MTNIIVDIDSVVADLPIAWLDRYNKEFGDNLKREDIHSHDIESYVKPCARLRIFEYLLQDDLYQDVPVIPGALEGVNALREFGLRPVFVTAGNHPDKFNWMVRNGFLDQRTGLKDYVVAIDKNLIQAAYMIDDSLQNCVSFYRSGGTPLIFDQPWNRKDVPADLLFNRLVGWENIGFFLESD